MTPRRRMALSESNKSINRIYYGWWIVLAAFLNLFFAVGILFMASRFFTLTSLNPSASRGLNSHKAGIPFRRASVWNIGGNGDRQDWRAGCYSRGSRVAPGTFSLFTRLLASGRASDTVYTLPKASVTVIRGKLAAGASIADPQNCALGLGAAGDFLAHLRHSS